MGFRHLRHHRFWLLVVSAIAVLAGAHYALFANTNQLGLPTDTVHSPDPVLFLATLIGLLLLAMLIRCEHT